MFTKAIVRAPAQTMVDGLTTAGLGKPDYALAQEQHRRYVEALRSCELEVIELDPDPDYPDAQFVEDTALLMPGCAIATRPGAVSRQGEVTEVARQLVKFYPRVETIEAPGTVEAGDIMMVGKHFYIGLSQRTNKAGAEQLIAILESHGYSGSTVSISEALHLKSSVSYLERNNMVLTGELCDKAEFADFNRVIIEPAEAYGANCVWVNDRVLVASGNPQCAAKIRAEDYRVIELDMSEFRKLDGGLSCLSLRF